MRAEAKAAGRMTRRFLVSENRKAGNGARFSGARIRAAALFSGDGKESGAVSGAAEKTDGEAQLCG